MSRVNVNATVLLCVLALIIGLNASCNAQGKTQLPPKMGLAACVSLPSGPTTLGKALRVLSNDAGVTIKAEPALVQHPLVVAMQGATVKSALEAIIDLNGWRWVDTSDGEIIVARPRVQQPQQWQEIIPAFQVILPPSLKRYLGIHMVTQKRRTGTIDSNGKFATLDIKQAQQEVNMHCLYEGMMNDPQSLNVWGRLPEKLQNGGQCSFTELTADERQRVMVTLLDFTAGKMYNSGNANEVLNNRLYHCQVNLQSAVLRIGRDRDDKPDSFGVYFADPRTPDGFMAEFATNLPFLQDKLMPVLAEELHP